MEKEKRIKITGEGVRKAVDEARSAGMDISFIYESAADGKIVRVGYFLVEKGKTPIRQPQVRWLADGEWAIRGEN